MEAENNQLRPELQAVVDDLYGLKALAANTGFMTYKSQRDILSRLTPSDQAAVGRALVQREKQLAK